MTNPSWPYIPNSLANNYDTTQHTYVCIDLKSFYASVECKERGLDPMTTNLVVADPERTEKTICLAVSPSMKAMGVPGRCRVFEIPKNIDYIMAPPRMQKYIDYSADIYEIYLKYISKEDIHVYSIDEVFMDVTNYLPMYQMTAKELGITIMQDILRHKGITATCGIGTNLYLAKIALDIKSYKSKSNSLGSGQVLGCDCDFEGGKLIVKEMADLLALELVDKGLVTDSITLNVGYNNRFSDKPAHGTIHMTVTTSSARQLMAYSLQLYERITDKNTPIHRFAMSFNDVVDEVYKQYDLFTDPAEMERELKMQKAMLEIKEKFGKNAILKGMNLEKGATTMERNLQIGGHKSGEY